MKKKMETIKKEKRGGGGPFGDTKWSWLVAAEHREI